MRRDSGITLLQIGLAFFLIVAGVAGLAHSTAGQLGAVVGMLKSLFSSQTIATIIVISIAVAEIIAGVFLIIELFSAANRITGVILAIFIVLWIINIILMDVIGAINGNIFRSVSSVLAFLQQLSTHFMILGSLIAVYHRFSRVR